MADSTNNGEAATWELLSVTDSMHALGPLAPGTFEETKEKNITDSMHAPGPFEETKDQTSEAMFMSGHFSLSKKTEPETLETLEAVPFSLSKRTELETLETLETIENIETNSYQNKSKGDLEGVSWMEPKLDLYSSPEFKEEREERTESEIDRRENEDSDIERRESEIERRENEERESEWFKKMGLLYHKVKEQKMLVVFVAATAMVGVAILSKKLRREKLPFEKLKFLLVNFSNERMNSLAAEPQNKIKDVFIANNQHRPLIHSESTF